MDSFIPDDLQLLRAERARTSYIHFVKYCFAYIYRKPFRLNWHHSYLAEHLEAVQRQELLRVIFNIPPRYSKSEMTTMLFDPWLKGLNPSFSMMSSSFSGELAEAHSKKSRDIVLDPAYALVFPDTKIKKGSREKANWETTMSGERISVGVNGSPTGRGGDGLVMDDPHNPKKTMDSAVTRKADINWFENTFYSRLNDKKRGFVILTMQRIHDEDLTGHLLERGDEILGKPYTQVIIKSDNPEPQVYSYGNFTYARKADELIWPVFEDEAEIEDAKVNMGDNFEPQYNQDPVPDGKRYFGEEGFIPYDYKNPPDKKDLYLIGGSDFAVTEGANDWTVHQVWGLDRDNVLWLLDMWREQTESDEWVEAMLNLQFKHKVRIWFPEDGQIKKSVGPFLMRRARERRIPINLHPINPGQNQSGRARSFQGRHKSGMCRYPTNAPWWKKIHAEMKRFPKGKHTDTIDPMALIGLGLDEIRVRRRKSKKEKKVTRMQQAVKRLSKAQGGSGKTTWMSA